MNKLILQSEKRLIRVYVQIITFHLIRINVINKSRTPRIFRELMELKNERKKIKKRKI